MKKLLSLFMALHTLLMTLFGSCFGFLNHDIVILYTNDVHCGIHDDIGCAGLAAYKKP